MDDWDHAVAIVARLITSAATPMALLLGPRGILFTNQRGEQLFSETGGPVNGRSVLEILPERAAFYAAVLARGLSGECLQFEEEAIGHVEAGTPRTRWVKLDFTPVCRMDGTIAGVLAVVCDVTALRQRIQQLSESEQRLRLALDGSGMVGIWTLDIDTRMCTADASVAGMYGLSADACAAGVDEACFFAAIHPDDRTHVRTRLDDAVSQGAAYRCRYRVDRQDGQVSWVITSAKPVIDDHGRVCRLLGVVVDVTDQMATASALAESRFQFRTLTEALPQIVWSCDATGRHDYFSTRWSEFTGISPESITEDTWKQLVYPEHQPMVASAWSRALQTGEAYDIDYRFRHHSGEYRWLRVMALPLVDDTGQITRWFGTSTDVHDTYRLTEEREELARELARLAAEDQLTGVLTRRAFLSRAAASFAATESETCASLLMLDIDYFKAINDGHGHPSGDRVLAATAQRIQAAVRGQDFIGRLGGEEFGIFLPQCAESEAIAVAERIRHAVKVDPVRLDGGHAIPVTVSIGATSGTQRQTSFDALVSVADRALYEAKAMGRNRVLFSRSES